MKLVRLAMCGPLSKQRMLYISVADFTGGQTMMNCSHQFKIFRGLVQRSDQILFLHKRTIQNKRC